MPRQGLLWLLWQKLSFSFEAITQILCTSTGTNGHWKAKLVQLCVWTTQEILVEQILYDETM